MPFRATRGFSLLEMILVLGILAVIASLIVPHIGNASVTRKVRHSEIGARKVATEIERLALDTGRIPTRIDELQEAPVGVTNWRGPYLPKSQMLDGWQRPYQLLVPARNGREFEVISLGSDGVEGGEGDKSDISSWQ